jgi:hypothetical protein
MVGGALLLIEKYFFKMMLQLKLSENYHAHYFTVEYLFMLEEFVLKIHLFL